MTLKPAHPFRPSLETRTYSYTDGDLNYEWSPDGEWLLIRTGYFSSSEIALVSTDGFCSPQCQPEWLRRPKTNFQSGRHGSSLAI